MVQKEIDGTVYADGTRVEAEYSFVVEDEDGTQYTLIAFNVRNSSPAYGTVEGIAFRPAGWAPPTGRAGDFGEGLLLFNYAAPICFDRGTLIETSPVRAPSEFLLAT